MTTIRDVAKECGVSAMVVSSVLNNRADRCSAGTRARILRVVEEMGYQPNAIARGLTRRRMNTVGVVLSYEGKAALTSDRYFSPIIEGIFSANRLRHQRTLMITEETWEDIERNLLSYMDGHCDGLIFALPLMPVHVYDGLLKRKIPFVLIGESLPEAHLSTVDLDNVQAGYDATHFLIAQGHRAVGLLNGDDILLSSAQREVGYRRALEDAGIACDERLVLPGVYGAASGYERTCALLGNCSVPFPSALFCADDAIASGAWRALIEEGRRVPEDVSLIGINNDQNFVHEREGGLTTIHQPLEGLGEKATEMLLAQIDGDAPPGEKFLFRGELIVRSSVASPVTREL